MKKIIKTFIFVFFALYSVFTQNQFTGKNSPEWIPRKYIPKENLKYYSGYNFTILNRNHLFLAFSGDTKYQNIMDRNIFIQEIINDSIKEMKNISNSIYDCSKPLIISDSKGIIHLIWGVRSDTLNRELANTPTDIMYSYCENGVWSKPEVIYHMDIAKDNDAFFDGQVEIDKDDNLYFFWTSRDKQGFSINYCIRENSKWGTVKIFLHTTSVDKMLFTVDRNNKIHSVLYIGNERSFYYYSSENFGKTWSIPVVLYKTNFGDFFLQTKILIDQTLRIHIFVEYLSFGLEFSNFAHIYSPDGKTWTKDIKIPGDLQGVFQYFQGICDRNNVIHTFFIHVKEKFSDSSGINKLLYSSWDGKNWQYPQITIENPLSLNMIKLDSSGFFHLLGRDTTGGYFYTHSISPVLNINMKFDKQIPERISLLQNYPNPFNHNTIINYQIMENGFVSIKIYDLMGREIKTLINENKIPGKYSTNFNASNLPSGVYYCRMQAGKFFETRKIVFLK